MGAHRTFTAGTEDDGRRLDRIIRAITTVPASRINRALRKGDIRLNGARTSASARVAAGDTISVYEGLLGSEAAVGSSADGPSTGEAGAHARVELQNAAGIVYEDDSIVALNKRVGVLVHGDDSLEQLVRAYLAARDTAQSAGPTSLAFTPGPLHRLDRNTSGLVLFSAGIDGARDVSRAIREGRVRKDYIALLDGIFEHPQMWSDRLARDKSARVTRLATKGRTARTHVTPILHSRHHTLARIRIETGITHQIRAQAAIHGHPLSGDAKYGSRVRVSYLLHSRSLHFSPDCGVVSGLHLKAQIHDDARARLVEMFGKESVSDLLRSELE